MLTLAALLSLSATAAAQSTTDYDSDNDGYIDVNSLVKLNAIRHDLNGNGAQDTVSASDWTNYTSAFPNAATGMGCPASGCVGYELTASLDFDTNGDGSVTTSGDTYWNSGAGWVPFGTGANQFAADFKGNGNTINNLFINRSSTWDQSLFGVVHANARIETLGVTNANVTGDSYIGILASLHQGEIVACYATGKVASSGEQRLGGLVGSLNGGSIASSYSTAYVSGSGSLIRIGGLVGYRYNGSVTNSYATGRVSGSATTSGGLIGVSRAAASGSVSASYWDTSTSGQTTSAGGSGVTGKTTRQLQTPTGYTGIYANWNTDLDNADSDNDATTGKDNPWAFGNKMQYPMLDYKGMSVIPQGSQVMGRADNWNAPIVGERVGVCLTPGSGLRRAASGGGWMWEKSANGDTWTPISGIYAPTYEYTPATADVGNYLRAKVKLSDNSIAYTRILGGRVKNASDSNDATQGSAVSFVSGNASPRVGELIIANDPAPTGAVDRRYSWQRCDNADTTYTDCSYIYGVWWTKYTPVAADVNKYLRMVVYYATSGGVWTRHTTAFTGQVAAASQ